MLSYSGDGGPALNAQMNGPQGVAADSAGDLFIADTTNNRIREVRAADHQIITVAGPGSPVYNGDNQAATSAELFNPPV